MDSAVSRKDADSSIDALPLRRFHIHVILLCAIIAILDGFDTQSVAYVAPRIAEEWGLPVSAFGPIFAAGLFGLMVGAMMLGPLADRIGRKKVILICVFSFGLFALLTATAESIGALLVLRFLTGIGLGGAMPNIIALVSEYAPARYRTTMVTIMFCGFPLGSTLGGFAAVPLIEFAGWPAIFIIGGIAPLFLLPILARSLPESIRFLATHNPTDARIEVILKRLGASITARDFICTTPDVAPKQPSFPVAALFADGRARSTMLIWTSFFMNLLVMYFLINWLPALMRAQGAPLDIAILSTALLNLGGVLGGVMLGRLMDKGRPHRTLAVAYASSALFIGLCAATGNQFTLAMVFSFFAGIGMVGGQICLNAITAASYPTTMRATGIGWALGFGRIGSVVGPVMGGFLLGIGWLPHALLALAVIPTLAAALAVHLLSRSANG